jgi:hypothetical protein
MSGCASADLIALEQQYGARNYHPLDIVVERAEGVWAVSFSTEPQYREGFGPFTPASRRPVRRHRCAPAVAQSAGVAHCHAARLDGPGEDPKIGRSEAH